MTTTEFASEAIAYGREYMAAVEAGGPDAVHLDFEEAVSEWIDANVPRDQQKQVEAAVYTRLTRAAGVI